jgi:uncharacterized protein YbjT (DUF2867 family)
MTSPICVAMLGASGAVGGVVARSLQGSVQVVRLTLINRRELDGFLAPSVHQHICDVENPQAYAAQLAGHSVAICCLGVGQPSKVSQAEFVRIDKTAALAFATACKVAGVRHFQLLSSVGASTKAGNYYLRTKGELQEAIVALGFERVSFFQPSVILTPANRYGLTQALLLGTWPWVSKLLPGGLRKFRGIAVDQLGRAIALNIFSAGQAMEILHWDQFQSSP